MDSIAVHDSVIDLVVEDCSNRFGLLTRNDQHQFHIDLYHTLGACDCSATLHHQVPESVERAVFFPGRPNLIYLVSYDGNGSSLELQRIIREPSGGLELRPQWMQTFPSRIGPIAVSRRQVAVPLQETGEVCLFAADDGRQISSFSHEGTLSALRYSPIGNYLAAGSVEGSVFIIDQNGTIRWQGEAHDRITQLLYNNSNIQIIAATAQGQVIFFNATLSSNPKKAHRALSLPLQNIVGIQELTGGGGWAAWSRDALIRIRNDLSYSQIETDGEILGMINISGKTPLLILADPRHTRLYIRPLQIGRGRGSKALPSQIDITPTELAPAREVDTRVPRFPAPETKRDGSEQPRNKDKDTSETSADTRTGSFSESDEQMSTRCFIMPSQSVKIPKRHKSIFYTAALPRSIDAGYRIQRGDIGYFYEHDRDDLIGPVTAVSRPEYFSMPANLERISSPSKSRLAIRFELNAGLTTITGAGRILHSFGLALKINPGDELYFSNPVLEGERARAFLKQVQQTSLTRPPRFENNRDEGEKKPSNSLDRRIETDPRLTGGHERPAVEQKAGAVNRSPDKQSPPSEPSIPPSPSDPLRKAIATYRSQQYDVALEALESVIRSDPHSLLARYFAAETHLKLQHREPAEMQFAAAIPPLGTRVQKEEALVAGFAALRLLEYDRANDIFSKLHAADPKNTTAWYGLQIARDRGQTPDAISYPETAEVAGFPIPLHEIAGIHSYTPVNGPEEIRERYFIMPGHSRTIDTCEESLVFHTPVQRSVDSGYRVVKGDIGYFYDLGRDSLSGPYFAASAPHFAQMPPDHRSERASGHTKNVLAIPLATKGDVRVTDGAGAILESLGFKLMKTHTGELYLPDPVLVGDRAKRFASLVTKKKAREASYSPGEYVMIVDGGFKGQRARVKEIDEEMDKIVVELDGVLLPVPIPLRLKQVSKERR